MEVFNIDFRNAVVAEINFDHPLLCRRSKRDRVAMKSLSQDDAVAFITHFAFSLYMTDFISSRILDGWKSFGKSSPADLVTACGYRHRKRLMRSFLIVNGQPF